MPPFLSKRFRDWPGTVVSGRFPLRSWPRGLNCVLEWQDRDRDWVLRRGDPMVYLMFDFDDPAKRPRMVEAAMTPPLRRHAAQIANVGSFGRNVRPMFLEAARRRQAGRAAGANRWRFQDQAEGSIPLFSSSFHPEPFAVQTRSISVIHCP